MAANYNSKLILTMLLYIIYFIVVYDVIEYNCNIWTDISMTWTIFNERPLYETINIIDIYLHVPNIVKFIMAHNSLQYQS